MIHNRRRKFRIAVLATFFLLFQQITISAYACTPNESPMQPTTMPESCPDSGAPLLRHSPTLCQKHCAPDASSTASLVVPSVPALALAPAAFPLVLIEPGVHQAMQFERSTDRFEPPPRLRYSRLLI